MEFKADTSPFALEQYSLGYDMVKVGKSIYFMSCFESFPFIVQLANVHFSSMHLILTVTP